jgi:hypothetical protein
MQSEKLYADAANDQSLQKLISDAKSRPMSFAQEVDAQGFQTTSFGKPKATRAEPASPAVPPSPPLKTPSSVAYDEPMSTVTSEELALQLKVSRLEIDKELLASNAADAQFREQMKDLVAANQKAVEAIRSEVIAAIAKNGEAFQTLRSDVNVRVASANENTEKLRSDMHKGFSEQHRWFIGVLVTIAIAALTQWFKGHDPQPSQQPQVAPIVINVPSAPVAPQVAPSTAPAAATKGP